jgi:APA family basic amino acid/polyamine antiporter
MSSTQQKMGFWAVFALVTGSQIGSGVFMLPAALAPYGLYSLAGWAISGLGAIALALVFGWLCAQFPQTGGPHVYVKHAFGSVAAFFTGWTYWVISWVSTTAVIVACIGYLTPLIGQHSVYVYLALEIALLLAVTALNVRGVTAAGRAEFFLTLLKFIPLIVVPFIALFYFDSSNFVVAANVDALPFSRILGSVTLLTLWGFIGLESATTPAGSVENPSKTIPQAIVWGTLCVALLYIFNCLGIMGLIPGPELALSKAPYVDAAQHMFGGNWHLLLSAAACLVCVGTLNAWILTSGQIALGLAQDSLMPRFFGTKNSNDAPVWALIISSLGILPLLFLTASESIAQQIAALVDISVIAFLFVYIVCCCSLLKVLAVQRVRARGYQALVTIIALAFCVWIIYETPLQVLGIASLFVASGVPMYYGWYQRQPIIRN